MFSPLAFPWIRGFQPIAAEVEFVSLFQLKPSTAIGGDLGLDRKSMIALRPELSTSG
jgi:hypothetical protein